MASSDLAKLVVRLEAQTSKYMEDLDKANRRLSRFQRDTNGLLSSIDRKFSSFGGTVRGVLAGLGVGFSFAKIISETQQAQGELAQLNAALQSTGGAAGYTADQLGRMADDLARTSTFSTGEITQAQTRLLTYTSLVGETYPQALQVAIDQSARLGMSLTQSAEIIGRALETPSRGVASLTRQGFNFTQQQRDMLEALEASGRTADAQRIVLDALRESYGGAASAARDTLGGALASLRNTVNDLLTGNGKGVTGLTEAINGLSDLLGSPQVRAGFETLVNGMIRVAEWSVKAAVGLADFSRWAGESFAAFANGAAGDDLVRMSDRIVDLRDEIKRLEDLGGIGRMLMGGSEATSAAIAGYKKQLVDLEKQYNEAFAAAERAAVARQKALSPTGMSAGRGPVEALAAPYDPKKDPALQDIRVGAQRDPLGMNAPMRRYYEQLDQLTRTSTERQLAQFDRLELALDELLKQGLISADTYNQRWTEAFDALIPEVEVTAKKIGDTLIAEAEKVNEFQLEAARNTQNILADALFGAMDGKFEDIGRQFKRMIDQLVANALAAQLAEKLFGANPGAAGSSGGWIGAAGGWLKDIFGGWRDSGGRGRAGQPVAIGVRAQPELFVPDTAGTFYPADQWMGGGGAVTQNIYVQGSVDPRTARQLELDALRRQRQATRLT